MEELLNIAIILAVALIIYKIAKSTLETLWKTLYIAFLIYILGLVSAMILQGVSYTTIIDAIKESANISIGGLKELFGLAKTVNPEESAEGVKGIIDRIWDFIKIIFGGYLG